MVKEKDNKESLEDKSTSLLRDLEWSKSYSYCTGWPCCPECGGIKPGVGADEDGRLPMNQGHFKGCQLDKVLNG